MTKFLLADWEMNGHDDSDFMCAYYDDVSDTLKTHMYGTTRFATATTFGIDDNGVSSIVVEGEPLMKPTLEAIEKARYKLSEFMFMGLVVAEERTVMEPNVSSLREGLSMMLKEKHRNQVKTLDPCRKCSGTGKWINPKNDQDQRKCFTCDGRGTFKGAAKKTEAGKVVWSNFEVGTKGVVSNWKSHGVFYSNGYNQRDAHNTTIQIKLEDSREINVPLFKLRLAREALSWDELKQRAIKLSYGYHFAAIASRFAWYSSHLAMEVLKANGKDTSCSV